MGLLAISDALQGFICGMSKVLLILDIFVNLFVCLFYLLMFDFFIFKFNKKVNFFILIK